MSVVSAILTGHVGMENHRLFEYITQLNAATTYKHIQQVCTRFSQQLGFDYFVYGARIPTSLVSPSYIVINGYPEQWRKHYIKQKYLSIDPTVSHCMENITPILWEQFIKKPSQFDKTVNKLFYEADDYGLRNGISHPIHCIHGEAAMFSFATSKSTNRSRAHIQSTFAVGQLFASYVHEAVKRLPKSGLVSKINTPLTRREKECLLWTTEGKTSWDISQILNIAERTVVFHINNATKKLDVGNKQHAVARAISLGLITPQF